MQRADNLSIPKIAHCIWVGHDPAQAPYLKKLLRWVQINQEDGFQFILWIDKNLASKNVIPAYLEFFKNNGVTIADCTRREESSAPLVIRDLNEMGVDEIHTYISLKLKRNYGEISDYTRFKLLLLHGGFYFDLPDIEVGEKKLIESGLFDRYFQRHVLACDYHTQTDQRPDARSMIEIETNTDALITTPNNPLIEQILQNMTVNLSTPTTIDNMCWYAYGQDNYRHTITTTGPQVLQDLLLHRKKLPSGMFQIECNGELVDIPPLRDISFTYIEHTKRIHDVGITWYCTPVVKAVDVLGAEKKEEEAIRFAFQIALRSIIFEVQHLDILRLDSHIDEITESTSMAAAMVARQLLTELDKLKLDYSQIQLSQCTYKYPETLDFYQRNSLFTTTHSQLPNRNDRADESVIFRKIADCISCKSLAISEFIFLAQSKRSILQFRVWLMNFAKYLEEIIKNAKPNVELSNLVYIYDILNNPLYKHFISLAFEADMGAYQHMAYRMELLSVKILDKLKKENMTIEGYRISESPEPNRLNEDGLRPLNAAIRSNDLEMLHKYLTHPLVDTALTNADGTGLYNEVCSAHVKTIPVLALLAAHRPDRDLMRKDTHGNGLLHYLCYSANYNIQIRKILLDTGLHFDFNARNNAGETPLLIAISNHAHSMTRALLLDVSPEVNKLNARGFAPLHVAAILNNVDFINQALTMNPPVFDPNQPDARGNTPLQLAIKHGSSGVVLRLLEDPRLTVKGMNQRHETTLGLFILNMNKAPIARVILSNLLRRGIDPAEPVWVTKEDIMALAPVKLQLYEKSPQMVKMSPLQLAVLLNHTGFADELMKVGAQPHVKQGGLSAFDLAKILGRESLLSMFNQASVSSFSLFQPTTTQSPKAEAGPPHRPKKIP